MTQGNLIAPIIVAIGVIIAAVAFAIVTTLLETADSAADLRLTRLEEVLATETGARLRLEAEIGTLRADLAQLRDDMSLIANRAPVAPVLAEPTAQILQDPGVLNGVVLPQDENYEIPPTEGLTEIGQIAKDRFNKGITQPRNKMMMEVLGPPRDSYGTECQPVTSASLKALLETRQIGPIKVTMLRPAVESLERVMNRMKEQEPDIYAAMGTAGAICARFIRGSTTAVSNHSWGTAIDLTLQGKLDGFADGGTQFGLLLLAEAFNDEGWFWGASYNREDSMHFEVGEETLRAWKTEGKL